MPKGLGPPAKIFCRRVSVPSIETYRRKPSCWSAAIVKVTIQSAKRFVCLTATVTLPTGRYSRWRCLSRCARDRGGRGGLSKLDGVESRSKRFLAIFSKAPRSSDARGRCPHPVRSRCYGGVQILCRKSRIRYRFCSGNPAFYGSVSRDQLCLHLRFVERPNFAELAQHERSLILTTIEVNKRQRESFLPSSDCSVPRRYYKVC